MVNYKGQLK